MADVRDDERLDSLAGVAHDMASALDVETRKRPAMAGITVVERPAAPSPAHSPLSERPSPLQRVTAPVRGLNQRILGLFVSEPSSGVSLGYLDGLRAIACLMVIAVHTWGWAPAQFLWRIPKTSTTLNLTPLVNHGGIGVELFFVLSGFLLSQSFLSARLAGKPAPKFKNYFILRFFRIVPAYYVCIFLIAIFFVPRVVVPDLMFSQNGWFCIGAHAVFMQYYFPTCSQSFLIDGAMWSLTMEATFYLILPVFVRFFYGRRWLVSLPITLAISVGWYIACATVLQPLIPIVMKDVAQYPAIGPYFPVDLARAYLQLQFPGHIFDFGVGIVMASAYTHLRAKKTDGLLKALTSAWAGRLYFVAGVALVVVTIYLTSPGVTFIYTPGAVPEHHTIERVVSVTFEQMLAVGFALVIGGVSFAGSWLKAIFGFTPLRLIGVFSYTIYLWHIPIMRLVISYPDVPWLSPLQRFPRIYFAILLMVIPLAAGMYLAVEKPFIQYARRMVKRGAGDGSGKRPDPDRIAMQRPSVAAGR